MRLIINTSGTLYCVRLQAEKTFPLENDRDSNLDVKEWFLSVTDGLMKISGPATTSHSHTKTPQSTQSDTHWRSVPAEAHLHLHIPFLIFHSFSSSLSHIDLEMDSHSHQTSQTSQSHQSRHICCPAGQTDRICNYLGGTLWLLHWTFTQESRPSYVMASLAEKCGENAN